MNSFIEEAAKADIIEDNATFDSDILSDAYSDAAKASTIAFISKAPANDYRAVYSKNLGWSIYDIDAGRSTLLRDTANLADDPPFIDTAAYIPNIEVPVGDKAVIIEHTDVKGVYRITRDDDNLIEVLQQMDIVFHNERFYRFDGRIYAPLAGDYAGDIRALHRIIDGIIRSYENAVKSKIPTYSKASINSIIETRLPNALDLTKTHPQTADLEAEYGITLEKAPFIESSDKGVDFDKNYQFPLRNGLLVVNFNKGTYDIKPFTPAVFTTHQYDVLWRKNQQYTDADWLISEILPDGDVRAYFYRLMGYYLFAPSITEGHSLQITSSSMGGKSFLYSIFIKMLGGEKASSLVSTVPFNRLSNPFVFPRLEGKRLNVCDETPSTRHESNAMQSDIWKRLVRGRMTIERKHSNETRDTINRAGMVVLSNDLNVNYGDSDDSITSRLHVILLKKKFDCTQEKLKARFARDSIAWLFNECLTSYADMIAYGGDLAKDEPATMGTWKKQYETLDTVADWIISMYGELNRDAFKVYADRKFSRDLYREYSTYCTEENDKTPIGKNRFNSEMVKMGLLQKRARIPGTINDQGMIFYLP